MKTVEAAETVVELGAKLLAAKGYKADTPAVIARCRVSCRQSREYFAALVWGQRTTKPKVLILMALLMDSRRMWELDIFVRPL